VQKTIDKGKEMKLEDIKDMSNAAVKKLLKEIDINELAAALKDTESEVREKIIPNLNKKARKTFDEVQDEIKKIKKSDIKKYQKSIEDKIKELFKK